MPPLNGLGIGTLLPVLKITTKECEKTLGLRATGSAVRRALGELQLKGVAVPPCGASKRLRQGAFSCNSQERKPRSLRFPNLSLACSLAEPANPKGVPLTR